MAYVVKNLPAMLETRVQALDQGAPLEKGMATHASILAWRIPWTEAQWATVHGVTESDMTKRLTHTHTHKTYFVMCVTQLFSV